MGTISKEDIDRILSAAQERGFLRDYDGELALSLQDLTRLSSDGRKELEELLEGARKQGISVGLEALDPRAPTQITGTARQPGPDIDNACAPCSWMVPAPHPRLRGRQGLVRCFA